MAGLKICYGRTPKGSLSNGHELTTLLYRCLKGAQLLTTHECVFLEGTLFRGSFKGKPRGNHPFVSSPISRQTHIFPSAGMVPKLIACLSLPLISRGPSNKRHTHGFMAPWLHGSMAPWLWMWWIHGLPRVPSRRGKPASEHALHQRVIARDAEDPLAEIGVFSFLRPGRRSLFGRDKPGTTSWGTPFRLV